MRDQSCIIHAMREKFRKIVESPVGGYLDKFCNSVWYIIAIGAVCVLCHSLDIPVVGAALLTVLLVPALLFCKNSFVLAPFLMMCAFVLSEETKPDTGYYNTPLRISVLCIALVIIITALLFNLIYYRKWKLIFKKAYFSASLALMSGALLIGGVGAATFTFSGVGTALSIAVASFLPYSLMINCGEYEGKKTVDYFSWTLIVAAAVIAIGFLQQFVRNDFNFQMSAVKDFLKLGYVGPNTGAAIVTMAIPVTFYFVYKYKHGYLFMSMIALELFVVIVTYSRASLVVALPGTIIVSIVLCFKKKSGRCGYLITFGLCVLAVVALAIIFRNFLFDKVTALFEGNVTGSGRTKLWKSGFNAWCKTPIFGIGIWFLRIDGAHWYYSFHCTPLTYLFCGGIVGLAAYVYHRYKTVRLVFSAKLTAERVFIALTVLAMLCNALLDIAMTSPTHLLYYGIMLALLECDVKKIKAETAAQTESVVADVEPVEAVSTRIDHADTNEKTNIEIDSKEGVK